MSREAQHVNETAVAALCRSWLDDDGDQHTEALRDAVAAFVPTTPDALIDVSVNTEADAWGRLVKLYKQPFGKQLFRSVRLVCTGQWAADVAVSRFGMLEQFIELAGLRVPGEAQQRIAPHAANFLTVCTCTRVTRQGVRSGQPKLCRQFVGAWVP